MPWESVFLKQEVEENKGMQLTRNLIHFFFFFGTIVYNFQVNSLVNICKHSTALKWCLFSWNIVGDEGEMLTP